MTCRPFAAGVVICGPDPAGYRKRYVWCPTCQCTTEMVVLYELWYGDSHHCCRCGDAWNDGEMYPRPFARAWRKRAVRRHRQLWDRATHGPAPDFSPELIRIEEGVVAGGVL